MPTKDIVDVLIIGSGASGAAVGESIVAAGQRRYLESELLAIAPHVEIEDGTP